MSKENCRIWIVDDNKEFLRDLEFALRLEGWEVSPYDDPIKFLEELNFDCPGCIILDVRMPILSGDEVQEHLLSKNCPLPVIFLTGHGDMNLAIHTFRHGAFDFIQKPFDPDYLFAAIEKALKIGKQKGQRKNLRSSLTVKNKCSLIFPKGCHQDLLLII